MPTSSGKYFLPPVYLATPGEVIRANQHNVPLEDIAQGLTDRMMLDGSTPMLADLPMNGYRIRGVAAATAAGDVPRYDQVTKASAFLNSASELALAANDLIYAVNANTAGKTTLTAFARTLLDDPDAGTMRATLGLGALATKDQAAIVADTTGTLPVNRGGTGATTAAAARTSLEAVGYAAQTLTAPQQAQARDNIGAADNTRTVTAGTGLTGGGDLTADRTLAADFATEAEALAGVATDKVMSPARVAQVAGKHYWQFTASGTWTKPAGLPDDTMVFVEAWGGGQSGGRNGGNIATRTGGNGGRYVSAWFRAADLPASVAVTIGAGGAARTTNGAGNNGGTTTIGALLSAPGGGVPLSGGVTDSGGAGGAGQLTSGGGNPGKDALRAGAGGGGVSTENAGAGGVSRFGGDGGAATITGAAESGAAPSGGGGATYNGASSGAGARGEVRIWI